jgi:hypothetical protein
MERFQENGALKTLSQGQREAGREERKGKTNLKTVSPTYWNIGISTYESTCSQYFRISLCGFMGRFFLLVFHCSTDSLK